MTPLEAAVVAAARKHIDHECEGGWANLVDALSALDADQASGEQTIPYGQIVSEDKVWSEAKAKWFEVLETTTAAGKTRFTLKGVKARFEKLAGDMVRVQRSETGQAMDMFLTVDWSGVSKA